MSFGPAVRVFDAYARVRYRVLFFVLLLTLAVNPLSNALGLEGWVLGVFVGLNLIIAAAGITPHRVVRSVLIALSAVAVVVRTVPEEALPLWMVMTGGLLGLVIAVMAMVAAVWFALRSRVVDAEAVAAALSAYLLAGLLFAVLYVVTDLRWPGSIVEVVGGTGEPLTLETAVYYSFVTLATLGYGDVVPRGVARGIAVVEAVSAQLYLTVTVARLVGLHTQASSYRARAPGEDERP
jgi:hypothetical protein